MRFSSIVWILFISIGTIIFPMMSLAGYWQQDVHYQISVALNSEDHTATGHAKIKYKNNSPDTLHFVWFHLYPNAYKDNRSVYARESIQAGISRFALAPEQERGYIRIDTIRIGNQSLKWEYKPLDETEMKVNLPAPLKPGESIQFDITFFIKIPHIFSRFGHIKQHYEFVQWYPKIVVYDKYGWHPDGYHLIGEFYGEFGTFDVTITVPSNMTVAATGKLVSPANEIARLDSLAQIGERLDSLRAQNHRKAIKKILKPIAQTKVATNQKTLRFHAEKVHDFAWVADQRFILKRGGYKNVMINVFVLPDHEHQGKAAVGYVYDTLEHYGRHYGEYPYDQVSVVDGDVSAGAGMEYPNLTIINFGSPNWVRLLEMVIMHEVGHNWFYGVLGNNEMAEAWLDEGMNSFAENRYLEEKYGREGNMTNWPSYLSFMPQLSDRYVQTLLYYLFAANSSEQPILTPAYQFKESYNLVYVKSAWMMDMLRELIGYDKFDELMQTYFEQFQFKHPTTEDFVQLAEQISGRKLDWFFQSWLKSTDQCDLAIKKIQKRSSDNGVKQLSVSVEQKGEIPMPATLMIMQPNGSKIYQRWQGTGRDTTFLIPVSEWPKKVWIDPEDHVLEVDNWNNCKPPQISWQPILSFPSFHEYQIFYGPTIWYEDDVDGIRPGIFLSGGQFRDFSGFRGRWQWHFNLDYGLRSEKLSYSLGFKHPIPWLGKFTRFEINGSDFEGQKYVSMGLNWRWSQYVTRRPELRFGIDYFYQDVYNLDYVNAQDWTEGVTSGATGNLSFSTGHYRFPFQMNLGAILTSTALRSDAAFTRVSLEWNQNFKWTRWLFTRLRLFGGHIQGDPGQHHRFFLSGGLVPQGPFAFAVDRRGRYSPQNYYFIEGDGAMLGYYRQHLTGKVIGTANFHIKLPYLPVSLIYDVGNVWEGRNEISFSSLKQDVCLQLSLGILKFYIPFWVSHPLPNEKKFQYRWLFGLQTSGFGLRL
ncbi:MAG: M1 family metallopeptidase [candidate division KSB1 bacterium]|nr:M1 family metallopeptidase [candidate division KSB1 bacterium]MDZ7336084.1 M1 family metallopeptidase [candidate division KSB1 bacterium]